MIDTTLFATQRGKQVPRADSTNEAGGKAYKLTAEQALAQYAATGCLSDTYYATAQTQLDKVLEFCDALEPEYIARCAVFARQRAFMKDLPALLTAWLCAKGHTKLAGQIWHHTIDGPKQLRNFVQIIRSGQLGRKSFGTAPRRLIRQHLESRAPEQIFRQSIGQNPSLPDIIKMVHPKPETRAKAALYRYLIGKELPEEMREDLPSVVKHFENWKGGQPLELPDVPFEMLTSVELTPESWKLIALRASWTQTRMNLNTFARHGVLKDSNVVEHLAARLRNEDLVARAKAMPYQLFAAFQNVNADVPLPLTLALQDAMEFATRHVPKLPGQVYVFPDVSGSMSSPVTGNRGRASTTIRVIDVAALFSAAIARTNPTAQILPFDTRLHDARINPRDTVMTIAAHLARFGGGGTACSLPLVKLNREKAKGDVLIYISDSQSWADTEMSGFGRQHYGTGTCVAVEWAAFKARNPKAKMVCIDVQPYETVQAKPGEDVLHVGGFSDSVFEVIASFVEGGSSWVDKVKEVVL